MGATRYMAVEEYRDERFGVFLPGNFATGTQYELMGDPSAFRPADYPEEVAALREEYSLNDDEPEAVLLDPGAHTVDEVNAHLADADEDEKMRVLDLERDGQARKGILEA